MKIEHLQYALAETARAYEEAGDIGQVVCEALRGVVARASRYEANGPDPTEEENATEWRAFVRGIVKEELEALLK